MLLNDKIAVIFGAGGAVGGAVARRFAGEGATVFLSGRHLTPVEKVAQEIKAAGGKAEAAQVDALNEQEVNGYLEKADKQAGRIDGVFNAIGLQTAEYGQGAPSTELPYEKFQLALTTYIGSQFLTARAAARHMLPRGSGVILTLSASPGKLAVPLVLAISTVTAAIEGMTRSLAAEWGPKGIRVLGIRPEGMPETRTIQQSFDVIAQAAGISREQFAQSVRERTMLKRMPTLGETAAVAAFLVSDRASAMAGTIVNVSCGSVLD